MAYQLLSNSPVTGKISWVGVRLVYDGVDYAIANGNTDKRFVYWLAASPAAFQVSDTLPALGPDDTIVFLNKNGVAINVLSATALDGDLVVPGTITANAIAVDAIASGHIQSDAIIGRHILAGQITAAHITVDSLQAISANMGSITSGDLTIDQAGFIRGGQIAYRNGRGFWLGYHEGTYKLSYKGASGVEFLFDGDGIGVYDALGNPILTATGVPYTAVTDTPTSLEQINSAEGQKLSGVQAGATRNVFRGSWAAASAYVVGDIVLHDGSGWACSNAHTSSDANKPPTMPVTSNANWQLYAAKGEAAEQIVTGYLTNEATLLPASHTGVVSSFADATGTFSVFSGRTNVTNQSTFSVPGGGQVNCTGSIDPASGVYSVTAMSADTAVLRLEAVYNGVKITKEFSLAKSKASAPLPPVSYWLTKSVSVISKRENGSLTPGSVTFFAKSKTGDADPVDYSGRFVIEATFDGTNYSTVYTSSGNESSANYPITAPNLLGVKAKLYTAGGTVSLVDEESVPVVADAVTYDVRIESTNGDQFRVGQSTTTLLKARVFRNGVEVTDEIDASRFGWQRVSYYQQPYPNDDATWNALYASGYKQIQINVDAVYARATFHCYVVE